MNQPERYDTERKGYLNRHDFNCYVIASLGFKPSRVDMNENRISFEEADRFVRGEANKLPSDERRLKHERDLFNSIAMGKGFISMHDIEVISSRILSSHMFSSKLIRCLADDRGNNVSFQKTHHTRNPYIITKTGRITFREFRRFLHIESSYT